MFPEVPIKCLACEDGGVAGHLGILAVGLEPESPRYLFLLLVTGPLYHTL